MIFSAGPPLRDIHMPAPPGWWPPAPGWWALAGIVLLIVLVVLWRRLGGRGSRRRWREVSGELAQLDEQYDKDHDGSAYASGVSQLLRRVARLYLPDAASATGEAWHAAVRQLAPDAASAQTLQELDASIYRPHADLDVPAITAAARQWLRHVLKRGPRHA